MIDLSNVIEEHGGHSGLSGPEWKAATQTLRDWYGGDTNESGVFTEYEEVNLATAGRTHAVAKVVQTPRGHWLAGESFAASDCGRGCCPSVWDREGYESREAAIQSVLDKAREFFAGKDQPDAAKVAKELAPAPQLDLFG